MRKFFAILFTFFLMLSCLNVAQARCSFSVGFGGPIAYYPPPPPPRIVYVPVRYYREVPRYVYYDQYEPMPYYAYDYYAPPAYYYPQSSFFFGYSGGGHCGGHRHWRHCH